MKAEGIISRIMLIHRCEPDLVNNKKRLCTVRYSRILEYQTLNKIQNPVILSVIHHDQNQLECN
jgi:hypothetical protein